MVGGFLWSLQRTLLVDLTISDMFTHSFGQSPPADGQICSLTQEQLLPAFRWIIKSRKR